MNDSLLGDWILGIDLGTNSLGWAIIASKDGTPAKLVRTGVRVFESAMDGNIEAGKEESRNRVRRDARLARRQHWRRARRLRKTFNLLQRLGLLPAGASETPEQRQDFINRLDSSISESQWFAAFSGSKVYPDALQVVPYILRARSLDERLDPHTFGRALYHLAQRRGFLSNRKQIREVKKEEEGPVKKSIGDLEKGIEETGARTLGEFFAGLSPAEKRIRTRYTSRKMYKDEFNRMWDAQTVFHPTLLTPEHKKLLFQTMFHQRPLRFDPDVIGRCELEIKEQRAPAYLLVSQRYRLLDRLNNLEVIPPGEISRPLTASDRTKLVDKLEFEGDQSFDQIRKLLGLTKAYRFNLEAGGEKKMPGNRTAAQFYEALCQRWLDMPQGERDRMVDYIHGFENAEKLEEAAKKKWNLDGGSAERFANISLEPDYLNFSRRAMEKLLPLLETGVRLATARKQVFPKLSEAVKPVDSLPPVADALQIRNPAVMRSLTELRKVVNAIIRVYGKASEIHVELARDLKKPKKAREATFKKNRENQRSRDAAKKRVEKEIGIFHPSRDDIMKVQLAEECGWMCPYTGRSMSMRTLLAEPQFDIEHILPFSRSLDNSFLNVTLCAIDENRNRKGNKTPHEAYTGEPDRYEEILGRVKKFIGERSLAAEKLRRFKMTPAEVADRLSDFTARQLGDTAYASRLAAQYLGLLYGGTVDAAGKRRVQATSGRVTAFLRNEWKLNGILDDGPSTNGGTKTKTRDDHRHHAVDAIAIGLTSAGTIKMLSDAAQRANQEKRRRFGSVQAPWVDFVDTVRDEVESIVVSHRVAKKVSGPMHEETFYGLPSGIISGRHVRKLLSSLSLSEVEEIVDPSVKRLVLAKLQEAGGREPKDAFADESKLPCFVTRDGRRICIRRVRLKKTLPTFAVGDDKRARHVASESNHHIEIFAELDEAGREVEWDGAVVPLAEAYRRQKNRLPVVQREQNARREFKFSLAAGETIECDVQVSQRQIFVVRKMSQLSSGSITIGFAPLCDARQAREMQKSRTWLWSSPDKLRARNTRKVAVGLLGEISEARD